jgi:hypothetical protein
LAVNIGRGEDAMGRPCAKVVYSVFGFTVIACCARTILA